MANQARTATRCAVEQLEICETQRVASTGLVHMETVRDTRAMAWESVQARASWWSTMAVTWEDCAQQYPESRRIYQAKSDRARSRAQRLQRRADDLSSEATH